jgi:Zn-dependent protease
LDTLYILPVLLFSIVVHEVAHGWMALRLGDTTARDLGRLTLNPIPHIDPIGSVLVPLISLFSTGSVFIAWAKPVPVNPMMFRNPRRDDILVSTVGPFSNLIVCIIRCKRSRLWSVGEHLRGIFNRSRNIRHQYVRRRNHSEYFSRSVQHDSGPAARWFPRLGILAA